MAVQIKNRWEFQATLVANEFIDQYMAQANGEYVKVYLYLLRHQGEGADVEAIASALDHTEADVKRALAYWEKKGVLEQGSWDDGGGQSGGTATRESGLGRNYGPTAQEEAAAQSSGPSSWETSSAQPAITEDIPAPVYSAGQVQRLSGDEEFSQLLYIAQKYLNKVFTPRDCQVFAYLYDTLKLSTELLEYLVEYCAQNGHFSLRYLEKVALNWHSRGIRTPDEAREFAESFNGDVFSVMKAFGLGDRRPGAKEQELIDRWFREYGFSRELVLLACDRTICAIHTPSFQYADRILSDWKAAGVKCRADVEALDEKRRTGLKKDGENREKTGAREAGREGGRRRAANQFHNFKQRDTDYDALVLKQLRERVNGQ